MFTKKQIIISALLCLLPLIPGLLLYSRLPDSVPTHFGLSGEADGYSPKNFAVFGMPLLMAALDIFTLWMINADPKRQNIGKAMKVVLPWIVPAAALLCAAAVYPSAMGLEFNTARLAIIFVGIVFIVLGNYMPKIKQNYTTGIKLPWTLNSEENWNRTHRVAGYLQIFCGILLVLIGITGFMNVAVIIAVAAACGIVPMIYSYLLYKKGI